MRNRDMPANPTEWSDYTSTGLVEVCETFHGKTKREEAAIAAMRGIIGNESYDRGVENYKRYVARLAVEMADALFDELDGEGE